MVRGESIPSLQPPAEHPSSREPTHRVDCRDAAQGKRGAEPRGVAHSEASTASTASTDLARSEHGSSVRVLARRCAWPRPGHCAEPRSVKRARNRLERRRQQKSDARAAVCSVGFRGNAPALLDTCKHLVSSRETCGGSDAVTEGETVRRLALYPLRPWSVWAWRRAVSVELSRLCEALPFGRKRKGLSHRARKLRACGTVVKVRECVCGEARAGSGRYAHPCDDESKSQGLPHPCEARSCWLCQRRRARSLREWLARQVKTLELPSGFAWSFLTVSPRYDVDDPSELDAAGLRARLDAARAAVRAIIRESNGAVHAAFVSVELAGTGHVHVHAMLAARYLDHSWLDATAAAAGGRDVHVWIERAKPETAAEVAKYVAKLCSPLDEAALSGREQRYLSDPRLLAAWEVATYGARVTERFGALRAIPYDEGGEPPAPQDGETPCHCCGTIGAWKWGFRALRSWLNECARRGLPALDASMQVAKRERANVSAWDQCFTGARNAIPSRGRVRRPRS